LKSEAVGGLEMQHRRKGYPGTGEKSILSINDPLLKFVLSDEIVSWAIVWSGEGDMLEPDGLLTLPPKFDPGF
jgi:hypothetical protein